MFEYMRSKLRSSFVEFGSRTPDSILSRLATDRFWPTGAHDQELKRVAPPLRIAAGHVVQAIISATDCGLN